MLKTRLFHGPNGLEVVRQEHTIN